jgi:hypothetical protein
MASGGGEERSLEQTPTWVVATVATVFVLASLLLERAIYRLGKVSQFMAPMYRHSQSSPCPIHGVVQ